MPMRGGGGVRGAVQYLVKAPVCRVACGGVPIAGCGRSGQGWMHAGCNMHLRVRQCPAWARVGLVCKSCTQLIFC